MSVKTCLGTFALYYVLGTAFVAAMAYLLKMNAHILVSFVVLLIATHVTVHAFVAANGRAFHKKEKWWVISGSLGIVIGLALATPILLFVLHDGTRGIGRFLGQVSERTSAQWTATLLIWSLEFVVLWLMYGLWAGKYAAHATETEPRSGGRRQTADRADSRRRNR